MPVGFVLAVFEDSRHIGYWSAEDGESVEGAADGDWFDEREAAIEAMGEIPRKHDVRVYFLSPSPDPGALRDESISPRLPDFLRQLRQNTQS